MPWAASLRLLISYCIPTIKNRGHEAKGTDLLGKRVRQFKGLCPQVLYLRTAPGHVGELSFPNGQGSLIYHRRRGLVEALSTARPSGEAMSHCGLSFGLAHQITSRATRSRPAIAVEESSTKGVDLNGFSFRIYLYSWRNHATYTCSQFVPAVEAANSAFSISADSSSAEA